MMLLSLALALMPGDASAQWVTTYEQFYLQAPHNWTFRNQYQAADRLFNAFDYGHAILYEKLWTMPGAPAAVLEEKEYDFLTQRVLVRPPRVPLEEAAIEIKYVQLAPEAKQMFEWAHILHRQIYDVLADERMDLSAKDREVQRLIDYYKTRPELAFSSKPKSMVLMQEQPYSLAFRKEYPKFNGLIWGYHWLQVGLYEPLVVGKSVAERQTGVRATVARFWQMLQDPPRRFPHQMPMTAAVAPEFTKRYPEAAIIFDNLHSMHDVISDVLANDSVPRDRKRAEILIAAARYRDDSSFVMTRDAWQAMAGHMGVENMGGPSVGFLPELPVPTVTYGAVMSHDDRTGAMTGFKYGNAVGSAVGGAAGDAHAGHGGAAPTPPAGTTPPAATPASTTNPSVPVAVADTSARLLRELHDAMMRDSTIRARVQRDPQLRAKQQALDSARAADTASTPARARPAAADPHAGHVMPVPAKPPTAKIPPGEQLGTVRFPNSCSADVASRFDRAVTLLHSFEFGASIAAFNTVLARDSTCAMAHWGLALSHWGNPNATNLRPAAQLQLGRRAASEAIRLGARATVRELAYARAVAQLYENYEQTDQQSRIVAYETAMSALVAQHPTDTEARIFHAIALATSASPTDKSYARQLRAGSILEGLWASQPDHPGLAHYIIHSYDYPPLAARAKAAAERYAQIAPAAAHALHMPSHTFTRVGQWTESAETNRRSMAVAVRSKSIAEALHAADYATYAYLQLRQFDQARGILRSLPGLKTQFDVNAVTGAAPGWAGVYAFAAIPARYALERRAWSEAARLAPASSSFAWTEAVVHFARALGAANTGKLAVARVSIDSLAAQHRRLVDAKESYWAEQVDIQRIGASAWLHHAQGRRDSAVVLMRHAADREDATEKSAVSPGPLVPARELLADMLMAHQRAPDALVEYKATLEREPNRFHALDGARRAAAAVGDRTSEAEFARALRRLTGGIREP
ncbi:MAG: hypothetical protein V4617_18860 [Gemmatimonadota bacterium]